MKYCYLTHTGNIRDNNEDNGYIPDTLEFGLIAVADGMGGHNFGEKASEIAIESVSRLTNENTTLNDILNAMVDANEEVFAVSMANAKYSGMGTTLTCAFLTDSEILLGHVGDSRAYLFSKNKLIQLTSDHTYVSELLRAGLINEKQAKTHARRNVITKCCGVSLDFEPELKKSRWDAGDIILLCSDGLYNALNDEQIIKILSGSNSIENKAGSLINMALGIGGEDNITVILSQNEEDDL